MTLSTRCSNLISQVLTQPAQKFFANEMTHVFFLGLLTITSVSKGFASENNSDKGLLKDVRFESGSEEKNQEKALAGELMISKAEDSAIKALEKILVKRKGTKEESELQLRLAELYIRKAKTGRFFDLYRTNIDVNTNTLPTNSGSKSKVNPAIFTSAKPHLQKAIEILRGIEKRDPQFSDMTTVLFNIAFSSQALSDKDSAFAAYLKIVNQFPNSPYVPDSLLSLGEMSYSAGQFDKSISYFEKIKSFPNSKAYPYAMYKSAWASYNLKKNDEAIAKLMLIVTTKDLELSEKSRHNLRQESLRDLVLFTSETLKAEEVVSFFKKITTDEEFPEIVLTAAKLYDSHSRHRDLVSFLNAFLSQPQVNGADKSKALTYLVDAHENLKQRKEVLETLKRFPPICSSDISEDKSCAKNFHHSATEISRKWWEIWEKNKAHKEFSELTEKSLEIVLSDDQNRAEDAKNRLSYADLLFQQEKYERASQEYSKVARYEKLERPLRQEALYSSLVAIDKVLEIESAEKNLKADKSNRLEKSEKPERSRTENAKLDARAVTLYSAQLELAKYYVTTFKSEKYIEEATFKTGFLEYLLLQPEESLKTLKPLAKEVSAANLALQIKSQDLILDILNRDKKFIEIKVALNEYLKQKNSAPRLTQLREWLEEAEFADLNSRQVKTQDRVSALEKFNATYPNSKLVIKAQLLLIPLYFEIHEDLLASETIERVKDNKEFAAKFSATDREHYLKIASETFLLAGIQDKAYASIKEFDPIAGCEYQGLLNNKGQAKSCFLKFADSSNSAQKEKALKYLFTHLDSTDKDLLQLQRQAESQSIEPWATEIQLRRAQTQLDEKNFSAAFDIAKKIMNKSVSNDLRARARLIQAKILEIELITQSVKTRADRLATILAMKTEKLDKAHTAYFSTSKMTDNAEIQREVFSGIQRIYDDYIRSLDEIPAPQGVSEAELLDLKKELAKLLEPMKKKREENAQRLDSLGGAIAGNFASKGVGGEHDDKFPSGKAGLGGAATLASQNESSRWTQKIDFNKLKYDRPKTDFENRVLENVRKLLSERKYELADLILAKAEKLFETNKDSQKWLNELTLLQKACVNDFDKTAKIFAKKFVEKSSVQEIEIARAVTAYQKEQYKDSVKIFAALGTETNYNYTLETQHINSARLSGDKSLARSLVKDYLSYATKRSHADRVQKLKSILDTLNSP